jgi:riboflavin synthase
MFTGLVQKVGTLKQLARARGGWTLTVSHDAWKDVLVLGESIAVQGACLTVTTFGECWFTADILDETLQRTALCQLREGARLNLERALALGERLGGHIVSGHIDETGTLLQIEDRGRDVAWRIGCSAALARQTVMKGSIAIDGVSLTVSGLTETSIEVNLIPHTLEATSLCARQTGDLLNLEGDILGKYVARLLGRDNNTSSITEEMLRDNGFL